MARKTANRLELRRAAEAAEAREADGQESGSDESPTTTTKTTKTATKRKRATTKEVRKKAFWAVFNNKGISVAEFDYSDKAAAEQKAQDLSNGQETPHFVQLLKKDIPS